MKAMVSSLCIVFLMVSCGSQRRSALGESCSKTADCTEGARCVAQTCVTDSAEATKEAKKAPEAGKAEPQVMAGATHEVFRVATVDPEDPFLNLRSKPKLKSDLLGKLPEKTQVKVKGETRKFYEVEVLSGDDKGKKGFVYFNSLRPVGSVDVYRARLSFSDHHTYACSEYDGDPDNIGNCRKLRTAAGIIRQDRAHYHKYALRDREDRDDMSFSKRKVRKRLADLLKEGIPKDVARTIKRRTPLVEVTMWPDRAEVKILKKGDRLQEVN